VRVAGSLSNVMRWCLGAVQFELDVVVAASHHLLASYLLDPSSPCRVRDKFGTRHLRAAGLSAESGISQISSWRDLLLGRELRQECKSH
jgi:hypothetical protein